MGAVWTGLAWFIGTSLPAIVFRIMSLIGVGFVTYTGFDAALSGIESFLHGSFSGLDTTVLQFIKACGIDIYMSMIFSAYAFRVTIGLATARLTRVSPSA